MAGVTSYDTIEQTIRTEISVLKRKIAHQKALIYDFERSQELRSTIIHSDSLKSPPPASPNVTNSLKLTFEAEHHTSPASPSTASTGLKKLADVIQVPMKPASKYAKTDLELLSTMRYNSQAFFFCNRVYIDGLTFAVTNNGVELMITDNRFPYTGDKLPTIDHFPPSVEYDGRSYKLEVSTGNYFTDDPIDNQKTDLCRKFALEGRCTNETCNYRHEDGCVSLCRSIIRNNRLGSCTRPNCLFSHQPNQFNSVSCRYFNEGRCHNKNCLFAHKKESLDPTVGVCRSFAYERYCEDGEKCRFRHILDCPEMYDFGKCTLQNCDCKHRGYSMRNYLK